MGLRKIKKFLYGIFFFVFFPFSLVIFSSVLYKDLNNRSKVYFASWVNKKRVGISAVPGVKSTIKIRMKKPIAIGQKIKKTVVKNPLKILQTNRAFLKSIRPTCWGPYKPAREVDKKIALLHAIKYPAICFLYECQCKEFRRDDHPTRTQFEKTFADAVKAKEVIYSGFGSGRLLADFVLLGNMLQKKKKIKAVHLIDIFYTKSMQLLRQLQNKELLAIPNVCLQHIVEVVTFIQFVNALTFLSKKKVDLYVHDSLNAYKDFIGKNPDLLPKYATAMDYVAEKIYEHYEDAKRRHLKINSIKDIKTFSKTVPPGGFFGTYMGKYMESGAKPPYKSYIRELFRKNFIKIIKITPDALNAMWQELDEKLKDIAKRIQRKIKAQYKCQG